MSKSWWILALGVLALIAITTPGAMEFLAILATITSLLVSVQRLTAQNPTESRDALAAGKTALDAAETTSKTPLAKRAE